MSSGEVILCILKYPEYKHRIDDMEGESDSKNEWKTSKTFCSWEQIAGARKLS